MGLTGELWPVHFKPFHDELLSSWLSRVALANAPKAHTFCHLVWPHLEIWTRDIDVLAPEVLIREMSSRTATCLLKARRTGLISFEGIVMENFIQNGRNRWIMPLGIYHRKRTRFGMQWCPLCLGTDPQPYLRKHWRFAFVSSCPKHNIILADRCHQCSSPILPYKMSLIECHKCGENLSKHPVVLGDKLAIAKEKMLINFSYSGATWLSCPTEYIHSIAFFDTLRRLMQLIAFGKHSAQMRLEIFRRYGGLNTNMVPDPDRHDVELMSVCDRHNLSALTARILEKWPYRFIDVCQVCSIWASEILKDMVPVRYHLWKVAKENLAGTPLHL